MLKIRWHVDTMKRKRRLVLLFFICVCFLLKTTNQTNKVYVCPMEDDMMQNLVQYRYQLLCNSTSVDCHLNHEFYKDTYSEFVILLHNGDWNLIKNVTEHLSYCNIRYILVDVVELNLDLLSKCSIAKTTLAFSLTTVNVYSIQRNFSNMDCLSKVYAKNSKLQNYISSTCPNTIWVTGSVDCENMTSFGEKILAFDNQRDVIRDKQLGRTFLKDKNLRISMIQNAPYFSKLGKNLNGDSVYSGILNNLLEKFSSNLRFTYSIHFPEDSKYGGMNDDKKTWNGMVGDLLTNQTDVIFADLTVTYERSQYIDFTLPYYFESIGILIKQPNLESKLWKMFSLFSTTVWLTVLASILVSSLVLFILHKFSARPIDCPYNSISECFWCTISCFANQGTEYDPATWSVQNFMAFFWLYVFAILSVYSGGLIAMLTSSRMALPFKDLEGLSLAMKQDRFKVCVMSGTAFYSTLMAGNGLYGPISDWLNKNPSFMTTRKDCTSKLIKQNDLAFLEEITLLEGVQNENCKNVNLILLNDRFFPGFFSIGLPKNSPLNEIFSEELTSAVDGGLIQGWKKNFSAGSLTFCDILPPDAKVKANSNDLTLEEFTGPFVLLSFGIAVSLLGFAWEICLLLRCKHKQKSERNVIFATKTYSRRRRRHDWLRS